MNKNTIYLIIGFFVILILLIFVIPIINRLTPGSINQIKLGQNDQAYFPSFDQEDQSIYYYNQPDSAIKKYKIKDKETESLFQTNLNNIANIIYSPDHSQAIIKTFNPLKDEGENWLHSLTSGENTQMSNEIGEVAFSPNGDKIAYRYTDWNKNINQVLISSLDESNIKKIADVDFGYEGIGIGWISEDETYYYPLATEAAPVPVYVVNINSLVSKNINKDNDINSVHFFENTGIAILVSDNNYGIAKIAQINKNGDKLAVFDKNSNLNRIGIANNILFIGVPSEDGDSLFQIGLEPKNEKNILTSSEKIKYNISDLMTDTENNLVYFLNNQKVYSIKYE